MKKGFTIIELLVASLLFGMLVTILTMIFNQSSIAWRTAGVTTANMEKSRKQTAVICDDADNLVVARDNGAEKLYTLCNPWTESGALNTRAQTTGASSSSVTESSLQNARAYSSSVEGWSGSSANNYIVNVMSAGPDRIFDTYDDIWSAPDDFE